ncbi:MAG: hypothetical protein DWI21_18815 [Planctomycetota bacterium]|nr:MAG: hypothetical protein DWI21_18815 [Planctomycetota bacterium]
MPDDFDPLPRRPSTPVEQLLNWLLQPTVLLLLSCSVAAWVFVPKLGVRLPDLHNDRQYRLATSQIKITPPPHWVPHDLAEQAVRRAGLPDELSLLDPEVTRRVAAAFELNPWVKGQVRVSTSVPARMHVDLVYREPVAMVRVTQRGKAGLFPIDADGTLLPSADFAPAEIAKYPVIENVSVPPGSAAGTVWKDAGVLGAARLAVELKPFWEQFGFQSILTPTNSDRKLAWDDLSLQLSTRGGSRVIWGRPPGAKHPGELPADKKIERIKFYLRHHGPFDSSTHGPFEYDITRWTDISRKPIADRGSSQRQ